jgi:hypothetical protein
LYVLGPTGLPVIAPAGGAVGAVLVTPTAGGLRIDIANLDEATVAVEPEPGLLVAWQPDGRGELPQDRQKAPR